VYRGVFWPDGFTKCTINGQPRHLNALKARCRFGGLGKVSVFNDVGPSYVPESFFLLFAISSRNPGCTNGRAPVGGAIAIESGRFRITETLFDPVMESENLMPVRGGNLEYTQDTQICTISRPMTLRRLVVIMARPDLGCRFSEKKEFA